MSREEMIDEAVRRTVAPYSGNRAQWLNLWLCFRLDQTAMLDVIRREFRAVCAEQGVAHE